MEVEAKFPPQNLKRFCDLVVGDIFADPKTSMVFVKTSFNSARHLSSGSFEEFTDGKGCLLAKKITVEFP